MTEPIWAAGVVLWRPGPHGRQVALVHRPKYDDWSLPKGKAEPGEPLWATAVRETAEETGFGVVLGRPLPQLRYPVGDREKRVGYWSGRATTGAFTPHAEIDQLRWLETAEAVELLTWPRDAELLHTWEAAEPTVPLLLVRHAEALPRKGWTGPDELRGLSRIGAAEAERLVPLLTAYGVDRLLSSDAARCLLTVGRYAELAAVTLEVEPGFSEHALDVNPAAGPNRIAALAAQLTAPTAICTHRPVLPGLQTALGIAEPQHLEPADTLVLHLAAGRVVAVEHHAAADLP